ncbi:MAG: hypothetical protein M3Y48_03360 [Actinomycetota bacterium]|nr:hypothetical protein [Actinomycetota bacterium]
MKMRAPPAAAPCLISYAVTSIVLPTTLLNDDILRLRVVLMIRKKIDKAAVLRALQTIEEDDYDGFVLLVQAARNRNVVFNPDLPVWPMAQSMGIIVDCNRGGVPEFDEAMRDFVRDRNNVDGSDKRPFVKGRH